MAHLVRYPLPRQPLAGVNVPPPQIVVPTPIDPEPPVTNRLLLINPIEYDGEL